MTAEIAILNRNAVALAADSAVTLQHPKGYKIYNTVSKLFMLSKFRPIGIMVYGAAEIMDVPWETLIKMFRSELGARKFDTVEQYAETLLKWLESNQSLFPPKRQAQMAALYIRSGLGKLRNGINASVEETIKQKGHIDSTQVAVIIGQHVQTYLAALRKEKTLGKFKANEWKAVVASLKRVIDEAIRDVLEMLPLADWYDEIREICGNLLTKSTLRRTYSGIVVAGFGEREAFPTLISYECDFVVAQKLRHLRKNRVAVGANGNGTISASIIPFAQREMVNRFMEGIDPQYQRQIREYLCTLLQSGYPDRVAQILKNKLNNKTMAAIRDSLVKLGGKLLEDFSKGVTEYQNRQFIDPIVASVELLPKDELAAMAESLVNLTAFKRKVTSVEADTVALPIDVAVISKGDGFVWIKRKHYFHKDLNPHFFSNYYRRDEA